MKRTIILFVAAVFLSVSVYAYEYTRTSDFILLDSSSAAAALSGACSAKRGDGSLFTYNPAASDPDKTAQLDFTYTDNTSLKISGTYTRLAMKMGGGNFGAGYLMNRQVFKKKGERRNMGFIFNYSQEIMSYTNAGASIKVMYSDYMKESAYLIGLDLGVNYSLDDSINLAFTAMDLGVPAIGAEKGSYFEDEVLPARVVIAADWKAVNDNVNRLSLSADAGFKFYGFAPYLLTGIEYVYLNQFYIRAGNRLERVEDENLIMDYLSAGLGINFDLYGVMFNMNYSYVPKVSGPGEFGESHIIEIKASF